MAVNPTPSSPPSASSLLSQEIDWRVADCHRIGIIGFVLIVGYFFIWRYLLSTWRQWMVARLADDRDSVDRLLSSYMASSLLGACV